MNSPKHGTRLGTVANGEELGVRLGVPQLGAHIAQRLASHTHEHGVSGEEHVLFSIPGMGGIRSTEPTAQMRVSELISFTRSRVTGVFVLTS